MRPCIGHGGARHVSTRPPTPLHGCGPSRRRGGLFVCRTLSLDRWFSGLVSKPAAPGAPLLDKQHHEKEEAPPAANYFPPATPPRSAAALPKRDYLEARQVSIFQLLDSDDFKFDIPVYQRPYSWGTRQVYEMLQDFRKAYAAKQEYFLGAIVTVRASDSPHAAFQVIDGQQRLTSLFLMLACLHDWAKEQGNDVLQQRVWRMLHVDADPLDGASSSRFRLRLREVDDAFFKANIMETYLPQDFFFSGAAAARQEPGAAGAPSSADLDSALPLEAEAHWRLYQNASFLRAHMQGLMEKEQVNLQEFMFHVLRSCYLVVMTARDEASSFRIFSTLNSRGVDLSEVDKLKADLLQVLDPAERLVYSSQWAEMENLLGRSQFHRVFGYMKELASVLETDLCNLTVLEYFTRDLDQSEPQHNVKQIIQVALDYSRILLQLRQAKWDLPASSDGHSSSGSSNGNGSSSLYENSNGNGNGSHAGSNGIGSDSYASSNGNGSSRYESSNGNGDGSGYASSNGNGNSAHASGNGSSGDAHAEEAEPEDGNVAAVLAALSAQSMHMNMFEDEAFLPVTLEFFLQVDSPALRLRFLRAAEVLALFLGLQGDAGLRAARWKRVTKALLVRPLQPQAILAAVSLSPEDKAQFLLRLESKDLAATVDQRMLAHLLLRAEGLGEKDKEEKEKEEAPEGGHDEDADSAEHAGGAQAAASAPDAEEGAAGAGDAVGDRAAWQPGSSWREASPAADAASAGASSTAAAAAKPSPTAAVVSLDRVRVERMVPHQAPEGSSWRRAKMQAEGEAGDVKVSYWHEMQRMVWQGKLGNLVLLPHEAAGASAVAAADYDVKAAFFRQCGAERMFPRFSGSISRAGGAYARHKFSAEECRQRHADLVERLAEVFEL